MEEKTFWEDYIPYDETKCNCNKCGWEGMVKDLKNDSPDKAEDIKFFCPECDEEVRLP